MNNTSVFDELDQAIDRVISKPDATPASLQSGIAELVEIARDLRQLPRTDFKMRLRLELEWQASGRSISKNQERSLAISRPAKELEAFPTLFGKECSIYPIRRANFATSAALHAAMFALCVGLGLVMAHHDSVIRQAPVTLTPLSPYVLPLGSSAPNGDGGGGNTDKSNASKGMLRFADKQLAPPTV